MMKNDAPIFRLSCRVLRGLFSGLLRAAPRSVPGAALGLVLALAGCAVGPDYARPELVAPARYKAENASAGAVSGALSDAAGGADATMSGGWKPAQPADGQPRGRWWARFGDAYLDALAGQVDVSNQNVIAAEARFRQAQGALDQALAARFPTLDVNAATTRGQSAASGESGAAGTSAIRNTHRLALSASWELDLWGRIRRGVEAGEANLAASAADLRTARLSAQLLLVQAYLRVRVSDAQRALLARTVTAYQRALEITRNRFEAGVAGRLDVAQAEAQLKSAQAQWADLGIQRAQYEHAIAALIGKAPADFSMPPPDAPSLSALPAVPDIPPGLPSALLERRPDIAAAERRVAAANAEIGVAQAAFFPTLTLGANGGYQASRLSNLLSLPNRFWSLGPTLALSLFDAGARSAAKARAIAAYEESVATYRQTVLSAFQEVEDALVALRLLAEEADFQREAVRAAAEALQIADNQYLAGTVSYLNVVSAQATVLSAERSAIDIAGRRLLAAAALIKALGGDWAAVGEDAESATERTTERAARAGAPGRADDGA